MKKENLVFHTVLALVLTLTIISLSVVFTLAFRPLYYLDISALGIAEQSGYPEEEIRENYDVLIDYNMSLGSDRLEFPTLAMSEPGRIHFEEVRAIFNIFKYMAIAGAALSMAGIVFSARRKEFRYLKLSSILTVALPALLGLLVAINWDWAFVAGDHHSAGHLFHALRADDSGLRGAWKRSLRFDLPKMQKIAYEFPVIIRLRGCLLNKISFCFTLDTWV